MKNSILVIVSGFLASKPEADVVVFNNLREKLMEDFNVFILTTSNNGNDLVDSNNIEPNIVLFTFNESNGIKNKLYKLSISPDILFKYEEELFKIAKKIISDNQIRIIITISGSFVPLVIGNRIKKDQPNVLFLSLLYDPLPFDNPVFKRRGLLHKKAGVELLRNANRVFALSPLYHKYRLFSDNMCEIGIGNLSFNKYNTLYQVEKKSLYYFGSLSSKTRNISYFINLIKRVDYSKLEINICGNVDRHNLKILRKHAYLPIQLKGFVSREYIEQKYNSDVVLLNIGNRTRNQIPSKTIEYISTGLPILNIEKSPKTDYFSPLKLYPNKLTLYESNNIHDNIFELIGFLDNPRERVKLDINDELAKHSPDYIYTIIKKEILRSGD